MTEPYNEPFPYTPAEPVSQPTGDHLPVPQFQVPGPGPTPLSEASPEQRRQALAMAVATEVAAGGRVESQTETNAVVVFGSKPNHTLHLILTLVTCFMWSLVWLIVAVAQKESRAMLTVDPYGQVLRQQLA